jgi:hypothetical protein
MLNKLNKYLFIVKFIKHNSIKINNNSIDTQYKPIEICHHVIHDNLIIPLGNFYYKK